MEETINEIEEESPVHDASRPGDEAIDGDVITKEEAATLLGLTPRALERYVSAGKLTVQYRPGKTRSVAIFDRTEVQNLADIRNAKKSPVDSSAPAKSHLKDGILTIRLDSYYMAVLSKEARKRNVAPSEYAARLLMATVDNQRQEVIQDLSDDIGHLAENLAIAAEGILVAIGTVGTANPLSARDARNWVEDNLRAERSVRPDDFDLSEV